VPRASRLEYSDVQAVIDAGTHEVDWVSQELEGVDLSDERLDRRLVKTAQQLAKSPVSPINEACGDWASTQAAYRLFDNGKASPRAILEETFVEKPRFAGTCYKAANWQYLGDTQGRGKLDTLHRNAQPIKSIWIYPLARDFRTSLCND